jgi:hypothetical protein
VRVSLARDVLGTVPDVGQVREDVLYRVVDRDRTLDLDQAASPAFIAEPPVGRRGIPRRVRAHSGRGIRRRGCQETEH